MDVPRDSKKPRVRKDRTSAKSASLVKKSDLEAVSTQNLIIERAIHMFNRRGVRNVSTDQIAVSLRKSPGNITYYFRRKRDLIRATLRVFRAHLDVAMAPPLDVQSAKYSAEYLIELFRTFWNFRFFFNDLTFLGAADKQLLKEYTEIREWCLERIEDTSNFLAEKGLYRAPSPNNSFRLLAENTWTTWLGWLRRGQLETPFASAPEVEALYDCALHHWSLVEQWLEARYAQQLLTEFKVILRRDIT